MHGKNLLSESRTWSGPLWWRQERRSGQIILTNIEILSQCEDKTRSQQQGSLAEVSHSAAASTSDLRFHSGPVMSEALGLLIPAWRVEDGDSQSGAHDASCLSECGFMMQILSLAVRSCE